MSYTQQIEAYCDQLLDGDSGEQANAALILRLLEEARTMHGALKGIAEGLMPLVQFAESHDIPVQPYDPVTTPKRVARKVSERVLKN